MPSSPTLSRHVLTRTQVARRLGVSTSSVRRLEGDRLHPIEDKGGVWRFDPAEVEAIAPRIQRSATAEGALDSEKRVARRGQLAARMFLMFARQRSLGEIVVVTKQPPEVVRELYREWVTSLEEGAWQQQLKDQAGGLG